jgi:hypothetical protein
VALAALLISIASALAAVAAVLVTYLAHKEQGSLLNCDFKSTYKLSAEEAHKLSGDPSEWGEQYAAVIAINKGRSATTIAGWGFAFLDQKGKPTDRTIVSLRREEGSPVLPYRLEGESSASWMMPSDALNDEIAPNREAGDFFGVVPFIRSGSDRMVYAPEPVRFESAS